MMEDYTLEKYSRILLTSNEYSEFCRIWTNLSDVSVPSAEQLRWDYYVPKAPDSNFRTPYLERLAASKRKPQAYFLLFDETPYQRQVFSRYYELLIRCLAIFSNRSLYNISFPKFTTKEHLFEASALPSISMEAINAALETLKSFENSSESTPSESIHQWSLLNGLQTYEDCPRISTKACPSHGRSHYPVYCKRVDCDKPECQTARLHRTLKRLSIIDPPENYFCYMLTLTWPNVSESVLIDKGSWPIWYKWSLNLFKFFNIKYWIRFTEITFNRNSGNYNPHFHCLVWVHMRIEYIELIDAWHRVSGIPNAHVHAQLVGSTPKKLISYFSKYCSKHHTGKNPKVWLKHQRTFQVSRGFPTKEIYLIGYTDNLIFEYEEYDDFQDNTLDNYRSAESFSQRPVKRDSVGPYDSLGPILHQSVSYTGPNSEYRPGCVTLSRFYRKSTVALKHVTAKKSKTLMKCPFCRQFLIWDYHNQGSIVRDVPSLFEATKQSKTVWVEVDKEVYDSVLESIRSETFHILDLVPILSTLNTKDSTYNLEDYVSSISKSRE